MLTRNCVHRSSPNWVCSWLNFGRPAPPGRGSAAPRRGEIFWLRLLQSARIVCVSPSALFSLHNKQRPMRKLTLTHWHTDINLSYRLVCAAELVNTQKPIGDIYRPSYAATLVLIDGSTAVSLPVPLAAAAAAVPTSHIKRTQAHGRRLREFDLEEVVGCFGICACCSSAVKLAVKRSPLSRRNQGPAHVADYCVPISGVADRHRLRSAAVHQLTVPRVRRSTFGSRAFASASPTVWNSLPEYTRDPAVVHDQFRRDLKTLSLASSL